MEPYLKKTDGTIVSWRYEPPPKNVNCVFRAARLSKCSKFKNIILVKLFCSKVLLNFTFEQLLRVTMVLPSFCPKFLLQSLATWLFKKYKNSILSSKNLHNHDHYSDIIIII